MARTPRPIYTDHDKRTTLEDLAARVADGVLVAVGGGLSSREPMALLRAMLRHGVKGLAVVGSAHGIDIDLLSGGGAISRCSESYVGFEQDFGMAPNYRRAWNPEPSALTTAAATLWCSSCGPRSKVCLSCP